MTFFLGTSHFSVPEHGDEMLVLGQQVIADFMLHSQGLDVDFACLIVVLLRGGSVISALPRLVINYKLKNIYIYNFFLATYLL